MRRVSSLFAVLSALVLASFGLGIGDRADAQGSRATVYVVAGRLPRNLSTAEALVRYARSHRARQITESSEPALEDRSWDGTVVMQFPRGVGERNFSMLIYDITDGERALVGSPYDLYVRSREEKTMVQDFHIERRRRRPNRNLEIVVSVRHQTVGTARVRIVGEVARGNGGVDFTQPGMEP